VQVPHQGDDHHPPRLTRALAISLVALAAAPAASAAAPRYTALPSPTVPVTRSPPLAGGAAASAEGVRHRIAATTDVRVSIDSSGAPFAIQALQTLDVRVQGDYFFTIGAPVLSARAAPGSESPPGVRTSSILWAGFNPGRRRLAATIALAPRIAGAALPLRIGIRAGRVTLTNATVVAVQGFTADAVQPSLRRYARQLAADVAAGRLPSSGGVLVTSPPRPAAFRAVAMLHVTGTVGGRGVDLVLGTAPVMLAAHGPIRLRVEPVPPRALLRVVPVASSRALLRRVSAAALDVARARQYSAYLGNPDPSGTNQTTYTYRSAARPVHIAAPPASQSGSSTLRTLAAVAGLLAAVAIGAVIWSRA
jgi:hypothetical protein